MDVECPWCAGAATIEVDDDGEFALRGLRDPRRDRPGSGHRDRSPAPPEGRAHAGLAVTLAGATGPAAKAKLTRRDADAHDGDASIEPLTSRRSAPRRRSRPTGWSPSEIVRAVLPIRPSSASGEYAVRSRDVRRRAPSTGRRPDQADADQRPRPGSSSRPRSGSRQPAIDEIPAEQRPGRSRPRPIRRALTQTTPVTVPTP